MGWNWEMTLLSLIDLAEARFVARASECAEYADFLLKARPSEARFAQVALLIQRLDVFFNLRKLDLLTFEMVGEVAIAGSFSLEGPTSCLAYLLTEDVVKGRGTTEERE